MVGCQKAIKLRIFHIRFIVRRTPTKPRLLAVGFLALLYDDGHVNLFTGKRRHGNTALIGRPFPERGSPALEVFCTGFGKDGAKECRQARRAWRRGREQVWMVRQLLKAEGQ
jgi:hypothetical protein